MAIIIRIVNVSVASLWLFLPHSSSSPSFDFEHFQNLSLRSVWNCVWIWFHWIANFLFFSTPKHYKRQKCAIISFVSMSTDVVAVATRYERYIPKMFEQNSFFLQTKLQFDRINRTERPIDYTANSGSSSMTVEIAFLNYINWWEINKRRWWKRFYKLKSKSWTFRILKCRFITCFDFAIFA